MKGFIRRCWFIFATGWKRNKAERVIFDGIVDLLIELGLVKRKGKQRLDSTHILGYVKEMSRLECAMETLRLALEDLAGAIVGRQAPRVLGEIVGVVCAERSGLAVKQSRARQPLSAMWPRHERAA